MDFGDDKDIYESLPAAEEDDGFGIAPPSRPPSPPTQGTYLLNGSLPPHSHHLHPPEVWTDVYYTIHVHCIIVLHIILIQAYIYIVLYMYMYIITV